MKKILLVVLILSAGILVGCSKKEHTLYTTDGMLYNDKKQVYVLEHDGNAAISELSGSGLPIDYSFHATFEECTNNQVGVLEDNCTVLNKKKGITYFSAYDATQWVVHRKTKKGLVCANITGQQSLDTNLVLTQVSKEIENLNLEEIYTKAVMDNVIVVHNFQSVKVRPNEIVVPGTFKVIKGKVDTNGTKEINGTTVGYASSDKYDYYVWNEYVIKAEKGYDVGQCVTFNQKK